MLNNIKKIIYKLVLFTFIFGELFYIPAAYASTNIAISNKQRHLVNTTKSKQGVEVVNIKNPNSSGLSHNVFDSFEVGESGVIFNNSAEDTNTTLGGQVNANANLTKGEEASTILGEVKSKLASNISGFMEVAGVKSDLIISNVNGINCNGCGFINVNRGVLTTGVPLIDEQGRLQSFTTESGSITIGRNGLNAEGADSLELISPLLYLDGQIKGNDTSLILGGSIYDYNTKKVEKTKVVSENYPEDISSVISSSEFGGIYGSRIRLVNLEDKIGLQLDFKIKAEDDSIDIESKNLNITNQGILEAKNNIDIKAQQISNSGEILAENELTIQSNSLDNYNTISGYDVYLYTDSFINNEGANLSALNNIYIKGLNGQNASYVGNISANINANNNIDIFADTFENKLAWYDFKKVYGNWVQTQKYYLDTYKWSDGIRDRYREHRYYVQRHRDITYEFEGASSSNLYAGNNINIQAESIFNQNSSIRALGDINLNANIVQNINEYKEGYREEQSYKYREVHHYKRNKWGKLEYRGISSTKNTDFKHLGNTVNSFTQGTSASIIANGFINIDTDYLQNGLSYSGMRGEYINSNVIQGSNITINAGSDVTNTGLISAEDSIEINAGGTVVNDGHMVTDDNTNIHANTIEKYEEEREELIANTEELASEMEELAKQIDKYAGKIYSLESKYLNRYNILHNSFNNKMDRLYFVDEELIALYRGEKILTNITINAETITGHGGYFASDVIDFNADDIYIKAHEIETFVYVEPTIIYKNKDTGKICDNNNINACYTKTTIIEEDERGRDTKKVVTDSTSVVLDSVVDNNYSYISDLEISKIEGRYLTTIDAKNDFVLSSSVIETPSLSINAGNINITAQSSKSFDTKTNGNIFILDENTTSILESSIIAGSFSANSGNDFILEGSSIEAGSLNINVENNILISNLYNHKTWLNNATSSYTESGSSKNVASSNLIAGSIELNSGNDTSIIASNVFGQDNVNIISGGLVNIVGDYNSYDNYIKTVETEKGFLKSTTTEEETQEINKTVAKSSLGSYGTINIVSAEDISILGSDIYSIKELDEEGNNIENNLVNGVNLYAGYEIADDGTLTKVNEDASLIVANMEDVYIKETKTTVTKKGLQSGWYKDALSDMYDWDNVKETGYLSFKVNIGSKTEETETSKETIVVSSNINSDGELNLNAGNVAIIGSNLTSEGEINIKTNNLSLLDAKNTFEVSNSFKQEDTYLKAGFSNAYVDAGYALKNAHNANKNLLDATKKANDAKKDYENGLISKQAYEDALLNLAGASTLATNANLAYLSSTASAVSNSATLGMKADFGLESTTQEANSYSYNTQSVGSNLQSLSNINIDANNLESVGTNFIAQGDINIKAQDSISIKAGQNTSYNTESSDFNTKSFSTNVNMQNVSSSASMSHNGQESTHSATYYNNSQMQAEGDINIVATNNIDLEGVNIQGENVALQSIEGDIKLASLQNTSSYMAEGENKSFTKDVNSLNNGSFSFGKNNTMQSSKEVLQASSILGNNSLSIKAGGSLELVGSLVASASYDEESKKLIDNGNLSIEVNDLIATDLKNESLNKESGYNFGLSGISVNFSDVSSNKESRKISASFSNANLGILDKESSTTSYTYATIGQGNITIGENSIASIGEEELKTEQEPLLSINRDINSIESETISYVKSDLDFNLELDSRLVGLNGGYNSIILDLVTTAMVTDIALAVFHESEKGKEASETGKEASAKEVLLKPIVELNTLNNAINGVKQYGELLETDSIKEKVEFFRNSTNQDVEAYALNDEDQIIKTTLSLSGESLELGSGLLSYNQANNGFSFNGIEVTSEIFSFDTQGVSTINVGIRTGFYDGLEGTIFVNTIDANGDLVTTKDFVDTIYHENAHASGIDNENMAENMAKRATNNLEILHKHIRGSEGIYTKVDSNNNLVQTTVTTKDYLANNKYERDYLEANNSYIKNNDRLRYASGTQNKLYYFDRGVGAGKNHSALVMAYSTKETLIKQIEDFRNHLNKSGLKDKSGLLEQHDQGKLEFLYFKDEHGNGQVGVILSAYNKSGGSGNEVSPLVSGVNYSNDVKPFKEDNFSHQLTALNGDNDKKQDLDLLVYFSQYNNGIEYAPLARNAFGRGYNSNSFVMSLLLHVGIDYTKKLNMSKIAESLPGYDKVITDKYWYQSYDTTLREMEELGRAAVRDNKNPKIDYVKKGQEQWVMNQPHNDPDTYRELSILKMGYFRQPDDLILFYQQ